MRYRNKKQSKRYRNKSPYLSRTRRYVPNLGRGGGYSGPRPYARSNFRHEAIPSSSAEPYIQKPSSEHYQIPTRERYDPEIQRLIFELNQLRNQKGIEQSEKSPANSEASPQGNLLREMMDAQAGSSQDYDTIERAEAFFKKSAEDEQARLDSFTEWVDDVTRQPHSEPLYVDDEPGEPIQVPNVELEPAKSLVEQTPALEVPNADMDILLSELYVNPLEAKKDVESVEQAENNVY